MKKILALTIAVMAASTAAYANEHEGGKCFGKGGHHRGDWLKKIDTNNDGNITRAESDAFHDAKFKKMDTDGDGTITKAEMDAKKAEFEAKRAEWIAKYDTDKDGKLSEAEREAKHKDMLAKYDTNKDGKLDATERAAKHSDKGSH